MPSRWSTGNRFLCPQASAVAMCCGMPEKHPANFRSFGPILVAAQNRIRSRQPTMIADPVPGPQRETRVLRQQPKKRRRRRWLGHGLSDLCSRGLVWSSQRSAGLPAAFDLSTTQFHQRAIQGRSCFSYHAKGRNHKTRPDPTQLRRIAVWNFPFAIGVPGGGLRRYDQRVWITDSGGTVGVKVKRNEGRLIASCEIPAQKSSGAGPNL